MPFIQVIKKLVSFEHFRNKFRPDIEYWKQDKQVSLLA